MRRDEGTVITTPAPKIPYEPALDGLRGLAVVAVVLFHAGVPWMRGGWLGVDAFFVLSGFLITALLLVEHRSNGRVGLRSFWIRRGRRLMPALFIVIGAIVIANGITGDLPNDVIRRDGLASLFYVANWAFITDGSSYFDQFAVKSPFDHIWSLAIEEQWYLLWPFVVALLLRVSKGSARTLFWMCTVGALLSAGWMAYLSARGGVWPFATSANPVSRLYFGTDTRAQSLLIGSALSAGLISGISVRAFVARWIVPGAASLSAVILAWVWATGSDTAEWYYTGGFLLLAILVAAVILAAVQPDQNPVRRVLSVAPLRWLGLISYGLYLWHWPVFIYVSRERHALEDLSYEQLTLLRLTIALLISVLSFVAIEQPIRRGVLGRHIRIAPIFAPISAATLALALLITTDTPLRPQLTTAEAAIATPGVPSANDEITIDGLPTYSDLEAGIDITTRPPPGPGEGDVRVLLVGDSVAYSMAAGFTTEVGTDAGVAVWNQAVLFCELAEGARRENDEVIPRRETCSNWASDWAQMIDTYDPDVAVVQIGAWEVFDRRIDGNWIEFGSQEYEDYFSAVLADTIDVLSAQGATVVFLTSPHFDRSDSVSAKEWTQNETWRTSHLNELLRSAAQRSDQAVVVDLGGWLCPRDECIETIETGQEIRGDGVHYTDEGAVVAAQWVATQLRSIGLTNRHLEASLANQDNPPTSTSTTSPDRTDPNESESRATSISPNPPDADPPSDG